MLKQSCAVQSSEAATIARLVYLPGVLRWHFPFGCDLNKRIETEGWSWQEWLASSAKDHLMTGPTYSLLGRPSDVHESAFTQILTLVLLFTTLTHYHFLMRRQHDSVTVTYASVETSSPHLHWVCFCSSSFWLPKDFNWLFILIGWLFMYFALFALRLA